MAEKTNTRRVHRVWYLPVGRVTPDAIGAVSSALAFENVDVQTSNLDKPEVDCVAVVTAITVGMDGSSCLTVVVVVVPAVVVVMSGIV